VVDPLRRNTGEDVGEIQLALAATLILLDSAMVPPRMQTRSARLRRALADVTPSRLASNHSRHERD
jgi:hypothetical protein